MIKILNRINLATGENVMFQIKIYVCFFKKCLTSVPIKILTGHILLCFNRINFTSWRTKFLLFSYRKIQDHSLIYVIFWRTSMGKQRKQAYTCSSALALRVQTSYILSLLAMSYSRLKSTTPRNSDWLCHQCLYRCDLSWDEFSTLPIFLHLQIYTTHSRPDLVYKRMYRQYGQSMNKMHRLT